MILIYGLLIISLIVFIHELGHFLIGKAIGIKFTTFSIGLGPRILKKQIGDTVYCISLLPIGGYVRSDANEDDSVEDHPIFGKVSEFIAPMGEDEKRLSGKFKMERGDSPQKVSSLGTTVYILGGAIFNLLFAFLAVFSFFYFMSSRASYQSEVAVGDISPSGVAANAGFKKGDILTAINGHVIKEWGNALFFLINSKSDKNIDFKVLRDTSNGKEEKLLSIKALSDSRGLGMRPVDYYRRVFKCEYELKDFTFLEAFDGGISVLGSNIKAIFSMVINIGEVLDKQNTIKAYDGESTLYGPVTGAFELGLHISQSGKNALMIFVLMSVLIALINLLPLPATDGCQLIIHFLEKMLGVPVSFEQKLYVSYFGLTCMLFLTAYLCVKDLFASWG